MAGEMVGAYEIMNAPQWAWWILRILLALSFGATTGAIWPWAGLAFALFAVIWMVNWAVALALHGLLVPPDAP